MPHGRRVSSRLKEVSEETVALDGLLTSSGSGLGALAALFETREKEMFPDIKFPAEYNTPVYKAAYIFSYLTCV